MMKKQYQYFHDIFTPRFISGYAKLIEDCITLRRFKTPPEQIRRFLGSNIEAGIYSNISIENLTDKDY